MTWAGRREKGLESSVDEWAGRREKGLESSVDGWARFRESVDEGREKRERVRDL